jgi:Ca-activated chloride channel family protein
MFMALLAGAAVMLSGCKDDNNTSAQQQTKPTQVLNIVAGSENESLEPIIKDFAQKNNVTINVSYKGSVDIMLELSEKGAASQFDAVMPAHRMWISLGDKQHVVKYTESIYRSPVVFGVKKSVAERLGWVGKDVKVADILNAAKSGNLRYMMSSATQSNSGASAYIGYLYAFAGNPDVLSSADLQKPEVRAKIKSILGTVNRTAGSSGWLKDLFLNQYDYFDAMVNYEAIIIETNHELQRRGQEPLYAVYPVDGLTIADAPLGYISKGDAAKEALFLKLQEHLKSDVIQRQLLASGRRTGLGVTVSNADARVFDKSLGIDVDRVLTPINMPSADVIREALMLYQTAFRKPSITIFALDYSGSMQGDGEEQLERAMRVLLTKDLSTKYMLQASPEDITIVIPFDGAPRDLKKVTGNDYAKLTELLAWIEAQSAGGETDIYAPIVRGVQELKGIKWENYSTAVILMTDGQSAGSLESVKQAFAANGLGGIPIYSIMFGNASPGQLNDLATFSSGRVFDGKKDLIDAFRKAKGYN